MRLTAYGEWVMTLADVSALAGLSWDIVKEQLQHDYGRPRRAALKHLAVDEIYVGRAKKFYTLALGHLPEAAVAFDRFHIIKLMKRSSTNCGGRWCARRPE